MKEFEEIFNRYTPLVFRFLLALCKDHELAEELTAETFYRAYLHIGSFRGNALLGTWLCEIAKNTFFREQKRRKRQVDQTAFDLSEPIAADADKLFRKEQAFELHKLIHALKEPYREVLMLRVFGELSFKEISHIFEKSESWAKVTYYRAKEKLIKKLEDIHED